MHEEVYADAIGAITVIGGTVRLDFVSYSPTEKDDKGRPATAFRQRVVMSLDGFMRSVGEVQQVAQTIVERSRAAAANGGGEPAGHADRPPQAPVAKKDLFP